MGELKVVCKLGDLMQKHKVTARMISDATGITESAISNLRKNKNKQVSLPKLGRFFFIVSAPKTFYNFEQNKTMQNENAGV